MADGVTTTTVSPAGLPNATLIATDDVAAVGHVQFVKIMDGTLDSATKAAVNANGLKVDAGLPATTDTNSGNKSASTLRVVLATDQPSLTNKLLTTPDAQDIKNGAVTAKGTQGASGGVPVQDLHDAGRSNINISVEAYNVASVSDVAINTFQTSVDDATPTTGLTDYTVTTGKKFRVTAISIHCASTTGNTTGGVGYVRIRTSTGAAISTSSPIQFSVPFQLSASATSSNNAGQIPLEDTWEIAAGHRIGASIIFAPYVVTTAAPKVTINISGYEY